MRGWIHFFLILALFIDLIRLKGVGKGAAGAAVAAPIMLKKKINK